MFPINLDTTVAFGSLHLRFHHFLCDMGFWSNEKAHIACTPSWILRACWFFELLGKDSDRCPMDVSANQQDRDKSHVIELYDFTKFVIQYI